MNTDPVVVDSVVFAAQPVGALIPGLPNLSGDIDEYAEGVDSQPDSFVSNDSEDYGTWCIWSDIDDCEGDYAPFRLDVVFFSWGWFVPICFRSWTSLRGMLLQ